MRLDKIIKQKYDFDVSGLGAYVEEQGRDILTKSVLGGRTKSMFTIQSGIKGSERLKFLDDTVTFQDGSTCGNTPAGDTVFTNKNIATVPIEILKKFCAKDLNGKWAQLELKAGAAAQNEELPFEQIITAYFMSLVDREVEYLIHRGDDSLGSGNLSFFDGFIKILKADSNVVTSSGTDYTMTNANAFDIFRDMNESIPTAVRETMDAKIFCGLDNIDHLKRNLMDLNLFHEAVTDDYRSYRLPGTSTMVEALPGLDGQGYMFAGKPSNFIIGVDLESDDEGFDMWFEKKDNAIYMRTEFRMGVQFAYATETTDWTEATS